MRLVFGPFVFDARLRAVTREGVPIALSPKAFRLLEALVSARPAPVPKDVLYDGLWPDKFVEPGNLHNLIAEIRRALDDRDHLIVRTAHGIGYSFDAREVEFSASPSPFLLWIGDLVVHLRAGETIIGRDPEATVVIESPDVSRQHARLFVSEDRVVVEDLGSKNGTFVDSERVLTPRVVRGAAEVIVGKTRVLLRKHGSRESTVTAK